MSAGSFRSCLLGIGLCLIGCRTQSTNPDAPASLHLRQPPVEQGEVWGPQDEANTDIIRKIFHDTLVRDTGQDPLMRRDAHPKHHTCVKGMLTIDPTPLRPEYRTGLFAADGQYQAWVRLSNGDTNPNLRDDKPNFRGLALKVMQVPYRSYLGEIGHEPENPVHDLLLANLPTFFVKDSAEYVELMRAISKGGGAMAGYAMKNGQNVRIIQQSRKTKVANLLDLDYHSGTPYKLGPTSMRMRMASCKAAPDPMPRPRSPDFLAERLEEDLAQGEACFVFYVQPNEDPATNLIEDPRIPWDTETSPLVEVGRLTLLQQTGVRTPERMQLCEHMTFNPWRAPSANRPMGQVNRVRLEVYARQSQLRTNYNEVEEPRPTSFDAP